MANLRLGVVGGSGLYAIPGMEVVTQHRIPTPFGDPSDEIIEARLTESPDTTVYFLPRHGRGHRLTPSEVPYAANIFAMKSLGVTHLLSISAVGIMREAIHPGDVIVCDQLFDRTKGMRRSSFFGEGLVGHVSMADPFCQELRLALSGVAEKLAAGRDLRVHTGGTYVCMEGPQFSSR